MRFRRWLLEPLRYELHCIHDHLIAIEANTRLNLEEDMATNDELKDIQANLTEAFGELSGLPAQIDALIAAAGDAADPELVASVKAQSAALANIVANPPLPEPTPEPAPVDDTPVVVDDPEDADPVEEAPVEAAPVDEAATPE